MRVVAGSAGGRRLVAPPGRSTRPTSDRVREAVFNSLTSSGSIAGATVVDLFAGSGALGIEALSRGAGHVTFVDHSRDALAAVRANLDATDLAASAEVIRADAFTHLATAGRVDLVLADPPYDFDRWPQLCDLVRADTLVIESDREIDPGPRWVVLRSRRHGGTVVTISSRQDRDDHGRPESEDRS